jgi:hypothetical protein
LRRYCTAASGIVITIPDAAVQYLRKPAVEQLEARRVRCTADDWWTAWRQFYF